MILFAGGWSDKRGKRKPCMLIPLLGELGALIGNYIILYLHIQKNNSIFLYLFLICILFHLN